jgi:hypothetical protein
VIAVFTKPTSQAARAKIGAMIAAATMAALTAAQAQRSADRKALRQLFNQAIPADALQLCDTLSPFEFQAQP